MAYPVYVVFLNLNAKQRKCVNDHGHTLLGFLLDGSEKMETEGKDAALKKKVSRYEFTSPEFEPLETLLSNKFHSSSRKKAVSALGRAVLSILEPLKKYTETDFEVTLKKRKVWKCFSGVASNCCDILEAREMSCTRHEACRHHPCLRCTISFENTLHGGKRPSRLLAVTAETQRQVQGLEEMDGMVSRRGQR